MRNGVSDELKNTIIKLMECPLLSTFNLGGGTNLSIKYNHRESIDIDLFTSTVLHIDELEQIINFVNKNISTNIKIVKRNFGNKTQPYSPNAMLEIVCPEQETKIDFIQNLQLLNKPETIDGIRLIHDDDIGALKLLAAANRGSQKDFYDLFLLTNKKPLEHYYELLMERQKKFAEYKTIFDELSTKPLTKLEKDISSLCDFNNANDLAKQGNQIILTTNSPIKENWFTIKQTWKKRVKQLAENKNLILNEIPNKAIKRGFKF
ncbi:MAG: nucleotidyl transferase AbiEii/AbiGii toxin family protein [Vicingaceae bacterium]|nr:nucleotidyl transferase AbiEii/AbiGii toxin family protein [Vicingaceae bacterium]